jgi:hypothetical protein
LNAALKRRSSTVPHGFVVARSTERLNAALKRRSSTVPHGFVVARLTERLTRR